MQSILSVFSGSLHMPPAGGSSPISCELCRPDHLLFACREGSTDPGRANGHKDPAGIVPIPQTLGRAGLQCSRFTDFLAVAVEDLYISGRKAELWLLFHNWCTFWRSLPLENCEGTMWHLITLNALLVLKMRKLPLRVVRWLGQDSEIGSGFEVSWSWAYALSLYYIHSLIIQATLFSFFYVPGSVLGARKRVMYTFLFQP